MAIDRLKQVNEEIEERQSKLDEIEATCTKENRGWKDDEKAEVKKINDEIDDLLEERKLLEKEAARKEKRAAELLAQQEEEEKKKEKREQPKVEVTQNEGESKEKRNAKVFAMINAHINNQFEARNEAAKSLVDYGYFPKEMEERNFSTLTTGKGGILVPEIIASEILDIEQQYGFVPQYTNNLGNVLQSEVKVPNILGRPSFTAVNQGSAISGSGFNLGGISLKPLKWGAIIDWTNEVDESIGARMVPIIQRKIAEALAYAKDDAFINGDGTSSYNNISGLTSRVGSDAYVRQATAATGNTSFDTLDADDFQLPIYELAPGVRSGAVFLMHPNMVLKLQKIKDGRGAYIYGDPSAQAPVGTLFGYPIRTSEAFPYSSGTYAQVCAFLNPMNLLYASGRELRADMLREGSVTNENGDTVNLATMDAQAIRWTALFDIMFDNNTRSDAGTTKGAFAMLRTNNS